MKAIMKRSVLGKVYFKKITPNSFKKIKKQSNTVVDFTKKERRKYFESLNPNTISEKKVLKNILSFLSEKEKLTLR